MGLSSTETIAKGGPFRIVRQPQDIPIAISEYFGRGSSGD